MRKDACLRPQTLIEALENLGYLRVRGMEWRRRKFHMILNPRKTKATISLHVEVDKISSSHHSRQHGKDIKKELERIKQEYRRLRGLATDLFLKHP